MVIKKSEGSSEGGDLPAIALTGYVGVEERMGALGAGYQMFVPKPVDVGELAITIVSLVVRSVEKISVGSSHSK